MIKKIRSNISSKNSSISLPVLALCWVSLAWGTTWIASKNGVKYMPPLQLAAIRQFFGGVLYISYFLFKRVPWPKKKQWKTIIILSLLNFSLSNALSTWGVKYISSGLGAIIAAIFPLWIVIISLFRGEKIVKITLTGLIVCFAGVCVVFYDHLSDFLNPEFVFGVFISIVSTISWAFGTLYTHKKASSFNPYFSIGLQMFISSLSIFLVIGATGTSINIISIPADSWYSILYLVIVGSVLTSSAFLYALQNLPKELTSVYAYINPIVAVLIGGIFFGELLTLTIVFGGIITIVGLYLVNLGLKSNKKI